MRIGILLAYLLLLAPARAADGSPADVTPAAELKTLNDRVARLRSMGDYLEATREATKALRLARTLYGEQHLGTVVALNNLAGLYRTLGLYAKAEPLYLQAVTIAEKTRVSDFLTARLLDNVGLLYTDQGRYGESERMHLRALTIFREVVNRPGPDATSAAEDFMLAMNNLASLYRSQGQFEKSEPLHRRVLEFYEQVAPDQPQTALALDNLGVLYADQGDLRKAQSLHERALRIYRATLGPEHPDTAVCLNNLAFVYLSLGEHTRAESLLQISLSARQKRFPLLPETALAMNNLATTYLARHKYGQAKPLLQRALDIFEKVLGPTHSETTNARVNLGLLYAMAGDHQSALKLLEETRAARENHLLRELPFKSDSARRAFLQHTLADELGVVLAWSAEVRGAETRRRARRLALETLWQSKGRSLEVGRDVLAAIRKQASEGDLQKIDALAEAYSELANVTLLESPANPRERRAQLEAQAEQLEADLSGRFPDIARARKPATLDAIQARIGEGKALVEMTSYRPFPASGFGRIGSKRPEHYLAFVVRPRLEVDMIDLGEREPLDALVDRLRRAIEERRDDAGALARKLDSMVMQPIRTHMPGVRDLWLSPEGALNLLPWVALVDEQGRYLVESHRFTLLTSGRDLLMFEGGADEGAGPAVAFGAPDFGTGAGVLPAAGAKTLHFEPLPATASEVQRIAKSWPDMQIYLGKEATEARLKSIHRPLILHLATHGFFFQLAAPPRQRPPSLRGVWLEAMAGPAASRDQDGLLGSGIALAGANETRGGPEDGLLSALEASALDLRGTKLVVLSACQTGQGAVVSGEGIYGLRRALALAGSEAQILTLWNVQDEVTAAFMVALHDKLAKGAARSDALREVQQAYRRDPATAHPFFWAAFFLQGAPDAFDGKPPLALSPLPYSPAGSSPLRP
jgi:CHAT domain-containing protein/Tfp pilus assembly protein PilF